MKTYTIKHGETYSATFTPFAVQFANSPEVSGIWRDFVNGSEVFVCESMTIPSGWLNEMEVLP